MLCLTSLSSCLNDDNSGKVTFSGVSVTVTGDEVLGYKLYTDFDAVLIPTSSSMAQLPWLKMYIVPSSVLILQKNMKMYFNWKLVKLMISY